MKRLIVFLILLFFAHILSSTYIEYEQAGVKEYWVIDPNNERMVMYALNEDRNYKAIFPEKNVLKSIVLKDFWLKPEWLWQDPLPNVVQVANQLKII